MDYSKRYVPQPIALHSTDIETLKAELGIHLARVSQRQPKDISIVSAEIPLGVSGHVSSAVPFLCLIPLPLAGKVSNIFTYTSSELRDITVALDLVGGEAAPKIAKLTIDKGIKSYPLTFNVPAKSVVSVRVESKTEEAVAFAIGLSFKEAHPDEIKKDKFNGASQVGLIAD